MNRLFTLILVCLALKASSHQETLDQLLKVNAEWQFNADGHKLAKELTNANQTSNGWIATHLMLVEQTLRDRSVAGLTKQQINNRIRLLDELRGYRISGVFPVNDYLPYTTPVFIDRSGTHCAVGYLMKQSGNEKLALTIDGDNKFVYVRNIKTKGVAEWAKENGFTIDELAWIQPGYPVTFNADNMDGGLNGPVKALKVDPVSQLLYAGGAFTASADGMPCNGVAVYVNGFAGWDWLGLGDGVNGTVNCMLFDNNRLYVGGEFTSAGSVAAQNIAYLDLNTQQWHSLGGLDSAVNALIVYNNELYAGGKFTGLISKWTGTQWQTVSQILIYGNEVRTFEIMDSLLLIGGDFELATGALRKNVVSYDGNQMGFLGMGTLTPVNDFETINDTLYAACDFINGTDTCALARFENFDWTVALGLTPFLNGISIKSLTSVNDILFCGGDFFCSSMMSLGNNLMSYSSANGGQINPLITIDSTINVITLSGNFLVFGGDFFDTRNDTLNHIGQLSIVPTGINHAENVASLSVFPNPATDRIHIRLNGPQTDREVLINVFDSGGKQVLAGRYISVKNTFEIPLSCHSGLYYLQATDVNGSKLGEGKFSILK